jgi:hypothetical protein
MNRIHKIGHDIILGAITNVLKTKYGIKKCLTARHYTLNDTRL